MAQLARRRIRSLVLLPLALLGCGGPETCGAIKRWMYEEPWRDRWQRPERVVAALGLQPGDHVADVGAGGGYFAFRLARVVGPSGRVYAVDVDDDLLAYVTAQAERRGLEQIVPVRAASDDPGLADASVDLVFLSNVFHHLPEPARYFEQLRPVLRPGGRVAIVEVAKGAFGHSTPPDQIRAQLETAGFDVVERHEFLSRQSFQVFALSGE